MLEIRDCVVHHFDLQMGSIRDRACTPSSWKVHPACRSPTLHVASAHLQSVGCLSSAGKCVKPDFQVAAEAVSKPGKRGKAATGKAKQKTAAKPNASGDAPPDSRKRKAPAAAAAAAAGDDGLTPGRRQRSKMDAR